MAGAEKIVERILEEARSKADASIEKAKKEAADIMRSAEEEARNRQKVIIDRAFEEAVERKKRLIAVGELEGRKQKLKAKQEVIEAVFKKAVEELNSLPADEYEKVLAEMIVNSASDVSAEIILSESDKKKVGSDFLKNINERLNQKGIKAQLAISGESRSLNGGFILKEGDVEINNSFEAIVKMNRDELEEIIVEQLF
jgi:V/A-type H+-transporting ATPase subunit E